MKRIVVHIDRLVLHGIDRHDAQAVSAGVQAELRRLLADPPLAQAVVAGGSRARIRAGTVGGTTAGGGVGLGQQVAGGIARGIIGAHAGREVL